MRKRFFQEGKTYWVDINKIKIQDCFRLSQIGEKKWRKKKEFYYETGRLPSEIILTPDYVLIDGYASYLIALTKSWGKVPVQFTDVRVEEYGS